MTDLEKQGMLTVITGEQDTLTLSTYLSLAAAKVLSRAYPYDPSVETVPDNYATVQVEIAAYMLNKRGAEGQTSHSENGVSRSYEDGDIPQSLLRQITPMVSVIKRGSGTP